VRLRTVLQAQREAARIKGLHGEGLLACRNEAGKGDSLLVVNYV
jgi:hypothetical protein